MEAKAPPFEPPQTKKAVSQKDPRLRRLQAVPRSSISGTVQEDQLMDIIKNPSRLTVPFKEARPVQEPVTLPAQKPADLDPAQDPADHLPDKPVGESGRHTLSEIAPVKTDTDIKEDAQSSPSVDIEKVNF